MLELALIESPVETGHEILEQVGLGTKFDTLHIGIILVSPLIGVTQLLHIVVGGREFDLVFQVGAEDVGTQLEILAIVVG